MSTISATGLGNSVPGMSASQQAKLAQDLKELAAALKANDTQAAQAAMAQVQMDSMPTSTSAPSSSSSGGISATNPLSKVASALQAGDLPSAQKEFSAFESDAAAAFQKRHGASANGLPDTTPNGDISADFGTDRAGSSFSVTA